MDKSARGIQEDPLSAASAGLLALAVPRRRRNDALELLAAMLDLADESGRVRLDQALFKVEQRLGVDESLDAYHWLETIDVVHRTGFGWTITNFDQHSGPVGATADSMAVLRKHLDSVGAPELTLVGAAPASAEPDELPVRVVAIKKWRRSVPLVAAGVAASIAAIGAGAQLIPQAAVTGRNVNASNDVATTVDSIAAGPVASVATTISQAVKGGAPVTTPATTAATTPITPVTGAVQAVIGEVPKLVATVTSVKVVQLPLAFDEKGNPLYAAIVTGTVSNTTPDSVFVQALSVVAHVVDGDTAPVQVSLASPLVLGNGSLPYTAVVALGSVKPTEAVTATATATAS